MEKPTTSLDYFKRKNINKFKAKMHNHPLEFDSVANRPPGVLILQYNHLGFLNW